MLLRDLLELKPKARRPNKFSILESGENYNWEDKICLIRNGELWEVFYFERGHKLHLKSFRSENAAVSYFVELGKSTERI